MCFCSVGTRFLKLQNACFFKEVWSEKIEGWYEEEGCVSYDTFEKVRNILQKYSESLNLQTKVKH